MSKFAKAAFAAALALPLVGVAGGSAFAYDFPAENDCHERPYGSITQYQEVNDQDGRCVGLDLREDRRGGSPNGGVYTKGAEVDGTGSIVYLVCNGREGNRDSALDLKINGASVPIVDAVYDGTRVVGVATSATTDGDVYTLTCSDSNPPAQG